jgi:hypothetical protein
MSRAKSDLAFIAAVVIVFPGNGATLTDRKYASALPLGSQCNVARVLPNEVLGDSAI